jgi:hypothetical protein
MRKRTILIGSALVAAAIVAVPTAANAANGGSWLLGRSNSESATTTVTNSAGTPLSLNAKSGYAPLKVNSSKTVTNLSADKVDGLSSGSFARAAGKTGIITDKNLDDAYGAVCPSGTFATSGGGLAAYDSIQYNGPDFNASGTSLVFIPNSWVTIDTSGYVVPGFVVCESNTGAVPGANTSMANPYSGLASMAAGDTQAPRHLPSNLKSSAGK